MENRIDGPESPENRASGDAERDQALRAIRPCSNAKAVRVAVLCRSSLAIMLERCFSTVLTLMHSRPAGFSLASSATAPNAATTGVSPAPCRTIENGLISRPGVHPTGRQNRTVEMGILSQCHRHGPEAVQIRLNAFRSAIEAASGSRKRFTAETISSNVSGAPVSLAFLMKPRH